MRNSISPCDLKCSFECGRCSLCIFLANPIAIWLCFLSCDIPCAVCMAGCSKEYEDAHNKCFEDQGCPKPEQILRGPVDPNEKGVIAERFVRRDQRLVYPIHFENIGEIEALDVFVTDILDANLLTPA